MARRYPRVFGSAAGKAQSRAAFAAAGGFFPIFDAALGALIESNIVTLTNVGSAIPLTISGGSYSKNGGAYSTAATTVSDGDTLRIRVTAPSTNSATVTATVSVNSIARSFSVTTAAPSTGTPTLALSATSPSIASNAAAGTLVSNISNVPAGATPTVTPNDGRLVIAGDASAGWKVVVGMSALSAGTINFAVAATGATGASGVLTVAADLQAFAYDSDAAAIHSAYAARGTTLSSGMKYSIHALVSRLKLKGVWQAMKAVSGWTPGLYFFQPESITSGEETINWLSPGTGDLIKRGSPTLSVRGQVLFPTISDYYETSILPSTVNISNFQMSAFIQTASDTNSTDMGSYDGSTSGIGLVARSTSGASVRLKSGSVTAIAPAVVAQGSSYISVGSNSPSAASVRSYGVEKAAPAVTPVAMTTDLPMLIGHAAGTGTTSPRGFRHAGFYGYLTPAQDRELSAAIDDLTNSIALGHLEVAEPGFAPSLINADLVVYGWTSGGMAAAYQAAKLGRTVAWVGGMLDHRGSIGGMSSSGLGRIDLKNPTNTAMGGLPRAIMAKVNTIAGGSNTIREFECRVFYGAMKAFLDPTRADGVAGITMYSSYGFGVSNVAKSGTTITSISTGDGRTFVAKQFIDASEEDDLAFVAGCTTTVGREAAGTGDESLNGYRGALTAANGNAHQFSADNDATKLVTVDPYVTPGNPASGLLPGIVAETETLGQADGLVQAYNVRLAMQTSDFRRVPLPTAFPSGFSATDYELLFRSQAASTAVGYSTTVKDVLLLASLPANSGGTPFDGNNNGGFSTDMIGEQMNYIGAGQSFSGRLASSQKIWNYAKGLLYAAGSFADSRVQSGFRTALNAYGFDARSFCVPSIHQEVGQPPRIYVREHRRLVGDYVHNANDIAATDGTTPRSIKTIGVTSYTMDHHHMQRLALTSPTVKVWNEGNVQDASAGGADIISPLPIEAVLPKAAEATNLSVLFGLSATSIAMSATRLEFPFMQLGMSAAYMAHQAITNANQPLQALDYPTLRTAILGAGYPVTVPLPQVN